MSRRKFPHFIDGYMEYTKELEATDRLNMYTGISCVASALQRKVFLDMSYGPLFPNLFIYLVGPPGKTRKSSTSNMAIKLLKTLPDFQMLANKITAASMLDGIENSLQNLIVDGASYDHCSILLYASELKNTFNTLGGSIAEQLTELYDSPEEFIKQTKHSGNNTLNNVCLNFLACTTVDWLLDSIGVDEVEGGLASRILFVVENGEPRHLQALPKVTDEMRRCKELLVSDLNQIYNLQGEFQMTGAASDLYKMWYKKHREIDMRQPGVPGAFMARKDIHVLKLAMVDVACRTNDLIITPSNVEWAIEKLNAIEPDIAKAFIAGRNTQYRTSCIVLESIERHGRIPKHVLLEAVNKDVRGAVFDEIITDLTDRRRIKSIIDSNGTCYVPILKPASNRKPQCSTKPADGSGLSLPRKSAKSEFPDHHLGETSS